MDLFGFRSFPCTYHSSRISERFYHFEGGGRRRPGKINEIATRIRSRTAFVIYNDETRHRKSCKTVTAAHRKNCIRNFTKVVREATRYFYTCTGRVWKWKQGANGRTGWKVVTITWRKRVKEKHEAGVRRCILTTKPSVARRCARNNGSRSRWIGARVKWKISASWWNRIFALHPAPGRK